MTLLECEYGCMCASAAGDGSSKTTTSSSSNLPGSADVMRSTNQFNVGDVWFLVSGQAWL
jgi:hypothetical protein